MLTLRPGITCAGCLWKKVAQSGSSIGFNSLRNLCVLRVSAVSAFPPIPTAETQRSRAATIMDERISIGWDTFLLTASHLAQ